MRDALERAPQQILFRAPDDFTVLRIHPKEPARLAINPADANRGAFMESSIAALTGLKFLFSPFAFGQVVGDGNNVFPVQFAPASC